MVTTTCRSVRVALAALCLLCSNQLLALGLGEIEVESSLNERFAGSIEIMDIGDLQSSEIIVSMASAEDFERVGVERFFYLTNLKFEVVGSVVEVTSSQAIAEPYLNFIVEVNWTRGRMLKEFTVLLDPPTFSQAAAPAVSAPAQSSDNAVVGRIERTQPETRPGTQVTLAPRPVQPSAPSRAATQDGTVMTTRNDTLWKIAERTLPGDDVTVNQQMLGIQRLNDRAFIKNNINLLKAGYVLRLPSQDEATELSPAEADAEVAEQFSSWRSGNLDRDPVAEPSPATQLVEADGTQLKSQIDATPSEPVAEAEQESAQGEVRILANSGDSGVGSGTETDESLTQLIEEKDVLTRQIDDLNARLDREQEIATNQVAMKEAQLDVQNQRIAELQQQLEETRVLAAGRASANPAPTPPPPTEWWASPTVLGGVIAVLVLILVGLLIALQRNRGAEQVAVAAEEYDDQYDDQYEDDAQTVAVGDDVAAQDPESQELDAQEAEEADVQPIHREPVIGTDDLEDVAVADLDLDTEFDDDDADVAEDDSSPEQSQTSDVIGEADIYIAYGRYGQAANLLLTTLSNEPERYDVRLKLLEVYVETSDQENFAMHAEYIVENCNDDDVLHACRELEGRLGDNELDFEIDPDAADTAEESDASPALVAQADAESDDFDLDLDSLDDVASVEEDSQTADAGADEFQLEFDDDELEGGDVAESEAAEQDAVASDLGGDLGLDFDPEKDVAESDQDVAQELDVLDFDVSDVEASDDVAETPDDGETDGGARAEGAFLKDVSLNHSDIEDVSLNESDIEDVSLDADADDEFSFDDDDADVNSTKLDLAEAYMDMGDDDGARDILKEVVEEGSPDQQEKAQVMLAKIA